MKAILVGNSDGIGLATTKRLLLSGWDVVGVSRSKSPITDRAYRHCIMDVSATGYQELLHELVQEGVPDLCANLQKRFVETADRLEVPPTVGRLV